MKRAVLVCLVFATYILSDSSADTDGNSNVGLRVSYTVEGGSDEHTIPGQDTLPVVSLAALSTGNQGRVRVRPRGQGRGFRRQHHRADYNARQALERRRNYRRRLQRRRQNAVANVQVVTPRPRFGPRPQSAGVTSYNVRRRAQELRNRHNNGASTGRLIARGSHSVALSNRNQSRGSVSASSGNRNQGAGIDPFVALQNGHRQRSPFRDRQTAYDFLSNGGNSYRARNEQQRERRVQNARMASVMCSVFGKQFVPSAIGGRCVDVA